MESWKLTVAGIKYKSIKLFDETKLFLTYLIREPFIEVKEVATSIWKSPATIFYLSLIAFIYVLFIGASPVHFYVILTVMILSQIYRIIDSGLHHKYYKEQHYKPETRSDLDEVRIDDGKS